MRRRAAASQSVARRLRRVARLQCPTGVSLREESSCLRTQFPRQSLIRVARHTLEWKIHWLFRLALFCEFVGHGAFGVLTKQAWVPYFTRVWHPRSLGLEAHARGGERGYRLGDADARGADTGSAPVYDRWGLFTALLRPLAGEGWWEFFERSYNFGVPLLMLWVHSAGHHRPSWFTVITDSAAVHRGPGATVCSGRCAALWPACSSGMVALGW